MQGKNEVFNKIGFLQTQPSKFAQLVGGFALKIASVCFPAFICRYPE
jgi:hypothetical protein